MAPLGIQPGSWFSAVTAQSAKNHAIRLVVPFHDLDPLQVVWHGNYLKYFDRARFALFDHCGIDLLAYSQRTNCFFPVTRTSTKHILPLRYGDEILVRASVREAHIRIVLDFEIQRLRDGALTTRGKGEQVAVQHPQMEMLLQIPPEIEAALTASAAG